MSDKEFQKFSDLTKAKLDEFKKSHRTARLVAVELEDDEGKGEAQFVVCAPSRAIINATARAGADKNFGKANDIMITNCVLGGDMKFLDEEQGSERVRLAVLEEVGKTISGATTRVKKL